MKLIEQNADRFVFRLGRREKVLLFEVLKLYPLVPACHPRQPGSAAEKDVTDQELLESSLAEHRAENRRQVLAMLTEPGRLQAVGHSFHLSLTAAQVEWLLQVLNDVRVGSWLAIGSPDDKQSRAANLTAENIRYVFALEVSGLFEMALLKAVGGSS